MITGCVLFLALMGLGESWLRRAFRNLAAEVVGEPKPSDVLDVICLFNFIAITTFIISLVNK